MSTIAEVWECGDEKIWLFTLKTYWLFVRARNRALEEELETLGSEYVHNLDSDGWYEFLLERYFRWKFIAANRYKALSRRLSEFHAAHAPDLFAIKARLFSFNHKDVREGLKIAMEIKGLGTAGASGLLALLFPRRFGTVDQFVVNALRQLDNVKRLLPAIPNPEQLKIDDGVCLVNIMRRKAEENNQRFRTSFWTPRQMDKILWAYGHENYGSAAPDGPPIS